MQLVSDPSVQAEASAYRTHSKALAALQPLVERYRQAHGQAPSSAAALAYDTVAVVAAALERAGVADRSELREALATMPEFHGITGRIRFRPDGDPLRSAVIKRVTGGGQAVFFREVDP